METERDRERETDRQTEGQIDRQTDSLKKEGPEKWKK